MTWLTHSNLISSTREAMVSMYFVNVRIRTDIDVVYFAEGQNQKFDCEFLAQIFFQKRVIVNLSKLESLSSFPSLCIGINFEIYNEFKKYCCQDIFANKNSE